MSRSAWQRTEPSHAAALTDARLQLHHAAQFAAGFGTSYVAPSRDDSHSSLGWGAESAMLTSHEVATPRGRIAVGLRVPDLSILVTRDAATAFELPLRGQTIADAERSLRSALAAEGLDPTRFARPGHYTIPPHPVAGGAPFDDHSMSALAELARWFGNAAIALARVVSRHSGASAVRVWPHHFDIATLISLSHGRSTGAGLELGDGYYAEPYWYVNAVPRPPIDQLTTTLAGSGHWHTHEWVGAVLPGSRVLGDAAAQGAQVDAFLSSALAETYALLAR